ncbi:MAG: tetratricopeptide repeat protein [Acidobacteria bacterium]|nr:tetratricopeptide repeat protein [Acidobacteriota bacterium]
MPLPPLTKSGIAVGLQSAVYLSILIISLYFGFSSDKPAEIPIDPKNAAVEQALFARTDFFGATAIVPFPTADARSRLAAVLEQYPDDPEILLKLAGLDEKLGRFDDAEKELQAIEPVDLRVLAGFYDRRAAFEKEAAVLERLLDEEPEKRAENFANLINFAGKHDLKQYLSPDYARRVLAAAPESLPVFLQYVDRLIEEKEFAEAARLLTEAEANFPNAGGPILEKRLAVLLAEKKTTEAVAVYENAFDPSWPADESDKFYRFLDENDAYRVYQSGLRKQFRLDPTDFQTAVRLIHLENYEGNEIGPLISTLETARRQKKVEWAPDQLLTISQFLIEAGEGAAASRFLYTVAADRRFAGDAEIRPKVIYQLFELLSDSADRRLPLTDGDLDFFETVAKTDIHPGVTTGLISLIFSDSGIAGRFDEKKQAAVRLFNRATAYRLFLTFRQEYPGRPELAQMYLDIVRLYTLSDNPEIAEQTLAEYEQNYARFENYADAAVKLADAYIAVNKYDRERAVYRDLLDRLGRSDAPRFPVYQNAANDQSPEPSAEKPQVVKFPAASNTGVSNFDKPKRGSYYEAPAASYRNYLTSHPADYSYSNILTRFVGSLARENKTREILDLYAGEIEKYPDESRLYVEMLGWLGQTNLIEKQLEYYRKALQQFPQKTWSDRFARWLIRNRRSDEFDVFSRSVVASFDDAGTRSFLNEFIDGRELKSPDSFDGRLFLGLYSLAHLRFPHNIVFVKGLLQYYEQHKMTVEWRQLAAEYYFESPEIRGLFLNELARTGQLEDCLKIAEERSDGDEIGALTYKLFRADASARLSDFEKSVLFYRDLNRLYPNDPEISENFLAIARSFGQTNRSLLLESADFAERQAADFPSDGRYGTRAGELRAELGDFAKAAENWDKLPAQAAGENDSYLTTATVYWDYFQFDKALRTIEDLRRKTGRENLYAFQAGAILEAQNKRSEALGEYLRALSDDDGAADWSAAKQRLRVLFGKPGLAAEIDAAFETRRKATAQPFRLVFNYADVFFLAGQKQKAVELLIEQSTGEKSVDNLLETKQFFRDVDESAAIRAVLGRLIRISVTPHDSIIYRLQLADRFRENYQPAEAARVLDELIARFPANYGVIKETEAFFWDLGNRRRSIAVLEAALGRARGEYLYSLRRKLVQRLLSDNRTAPAEKILLRLQDENPSDDEVFSELTGLYVRTARPDALRQALDRNLEALKKQGLEPRELNWITADLREKMIDAFTRLKDYDSAAEQYVEIINRDPDDEEKLDRAFAYVKRFGGASKMIDYYRKLAAESFKNYRWNLVLGRLYEAEKDYPNALENYRIAIFNQPEDLALYEELAGLQTVMQNYEAALTTIDKMLELSNEDAKYRRQKIALLEKLGRFAEAAAEKNKLPAEQIPPPAPETDRFDAARQLSAGDSEQAPETFLAAFDDLLNAPFRQELRPADVEDFVKTVHRRDPLDSIVPKLLALREKYSAALDDPDSVVAGRARRSLSVLDKAIVGALAGEIKTRASGAEIIYLRSLIDSELQTTADADSGRLSLLQNLAAGCGFDDLLEKNLIAAYQNSPNEGRAAVNLQPLLAFYQNRGRFREVLYLLDPKLESRPLEQVRLYAENARSAGDPEKEKKALGIVFARQSGDDELTGRYLEILYRDDRQKLDELIDGPTVHQLRLINFLLSKNEKEAAAEAVRNSTLPDGWKTSRTAQIESQLKPDAPDRNEFYRNALGLAPIGGLIALDPDKKPALAGAEWFAAAGLYGKWLAAGPHREQAELYLPAGIESRPQDAARQFSLGYYYLEQKDFDRALEHFGIAGQLAPDDRSFLPYVGAAYFQKGERQKAIETWSRIVENEDPTVDDAVLYLRTMADFGQSEQARDDLKPFVLNHLKENPDDDDQFPANLKELIRDLAKTFDSESRKTAYFLALCLESGKNSRLPQILIEETLIGPADRGKFYEIWIRSASGFDSYEHDYDYVLQLEATSNAADAELLYDSEKDFESPEPENEKLRRRQAYLDFLLENRNWPAAAKLIAEIEDSLKGHYARPVWLRLAALRVKIRQNVPVGRDLLQFTGIEIHPTSSKAPLPDLDRLNAAAAVLEETGRADLLPPLREAFYARRIALEQFETEDFAGLARIEFEKGETAAGLSLLKIMTAFSEPEMRSELDAMPLIQKFANRENLPVEPQNDLQTTAALRVAAEMAAEFGLYAEAAAFRERLFETAPADIGNRIEKARLQEKLNGPAEAAARLVEISADLRIERRYRWQSLLVLAEICGRNPGLREKFAAENPFSASRETEMETALKAFLTARNGDPQGAAAMLGENGYSGELVFLRALFEREAGLGDAAFDDLMKVAGQSFQLTQIFGFREKSPVGLAIENRLEAGKTETALALAGKFGLLKNAGTSAAVFRDSEFETLDRRNRRTQAEAVRRIIEALSPAAEQTGDLAAAIEYEKAFGSLAGSTEKAAESARRLEALQFKLADQNAKNAGSPVITEKYFTDF